MDGASETEEQRILAAAAPLEAIRFSMLMTSGTDLDAEKDGGASSVGEKVWPTDSFYQDNRCTLC